MSDLSANVAWQGILQEDVPHCRAIVAPVKYHDEIVESLARLTLGSYRPSHPDLLIAGTLDKPPDIDACRKLIQDIALKPLESSRRMGVILSAGRMNLNAGNSLLKLAEEPPDHACILFLMDDARLFLPTLRSRSHFTVITTDDKLESQKPPSTTAEWSSWLSLTRKPNVDSESLSRTLESWTNCAADSGDYPMAEKLYRLKLLADKKNLSVPLLCDAVILTLREDDKDIEHILSDIW